MFQGHIKQYFGVIEQDDITFVFVDNLVQKTWHLEGSLAFGEIQHAAREFEINVDDRSIDVPADFPQRLCLT